ncbi:SCO family protein [Shinella daejeonensis]|uniref:SCO family protein n=1 Tax=Shinella daejeonensis TaxID=659017 RepID=UPI0020C83193|nr:SCO family protein [Shinella daejeonensis]MCP8897400.1 SCO family protein [Shinella daejeonensis]
MASSTLRTARTVLWTLVAVAALGVGWVYVSQTVLQPQPRTIAGSAYGTGDYQLVDHNGEPFTYQSLLGRPAMVFFGFTHCPDVCPTTLADMTVWYERLGADADDLAAYFVSVDPERDTPEIIGNYVGWTERVVGVTGDRAEIDKAISAWGVYARRVENDGDGYNVDHTASVFLIDPQGGFFGTIAYMENTETAIGKLRRLLGPG